jgi:hypothetical protein
VGTGHANAKNATDATGDPHETILTENRRTVAAVSFQKPRLIGIGAVLCEETYADLRHLAESILPSEQRPSTYEIPPFDASLHESATGAFEVLAAIRIEHRHGFFDPVDACEERCLREMC